MAKRFQVINAKTGQVLGEIESFRKALPWNGKGMRPTVNWFRLVNDHSSEADTKSCLAAYLGGQEKTKVIAI